MTNKIKLILPIIFSISFLYSNPIEEIGIYEIKNHNQLRAELSSNDNISPLELNFLYNEITHILDELQTGFTNTRILEQDFYNLLDYIKDLVEADDVKIKSEELWVYLQENPSEVYKELEVLKNSINS